MSTAVREYYYLAEIAEIWQVNLRDIEHMVETGKITACVFLQNVTTEYGEYDKNYDWNLTGPRDPRFEYGFSEEGLPLLPFEADDIVGLFPLFSKDCRKIFQQGSTNILFFQLSDVYRYHDCCEYCRVYEDGGVTVTREELVIKPDEKIRCETFLGMEAKKEKRNGIAMILNLLGKVLNTPKN